MRTDLYSLIHKAQRFHLFRIANALSRCDLADAAAMDALAIKVHAIIEHLQDHARNEEIYIHPLYERIGSPPAVLEDEYRRLEMELTEMTSILDNRRWDDLYPAFARFVGGYLLHTAAEERDQRDILWPNLPDDDLASVFRRFKTERSPTLARADLVFMLPSLSIRELSGMYRGMKSSAPPAAFQGACALAVETLETPVWEKVLATI